jgi:hypothetical protein
MDQPEVIVDVIRTVVETARGHDVSPCATRTTSADLVMLLASAMNVQAPDATDKSLRGDG